MADIRIKDLATTASVTASDDFMAVDGTTSGTRKLSAATPSFATSVTTPSLTSPASTNLTLGTGTSGAAITVLSASNSIGINCTNPLTIGTNTAVSDVIAVGASTGSGKFYIRGSTGGEFGWDATSAASGFKITRLLNTNGVITLERISDAFSAINSTVFQITTANNLLIGGTTDITGSGGLKVFGTTAASSTTSGALQVAGGVGVAGAGYFGGNLNASGVDSQFISSGAVHNFSIGSSGAFNGILRYVTDNAVAWSSGVQTSNDAYVLGYGNGFGDPKFTMTTLGVANFTNTTSASSSTVGALTIGNGTAATNVAIGGGSMIAGANVQAVGNINVGAVGADFSAGRINIQAASDTVPGLNFGGVNYGFGILEKTDGNLYFSRRSGSATNTTWLSVDRGTGAATFAGAVTINSNVYLAQLDASNSGLWLNKGTPSGSNYSMLGSASSTYLNAPTGGGVNVRINNSDVAIFNASSATFAGTVIHTLSATPASASATGTVGTMSWDASYIYICTATNTWKRVAIATW